MTTDEYAGDTTERVQKLLRTREVEDVTGWSRSTIERHIKAGTLVVIRVNGTRRITAESLAALLRVGTT